MQNNMIPTAAMTKKTKIRMPLPRLMRLQRRHKQMLAGAALTLAASTLALSATSSVANPFNDWLNKTFGAKQEQTIKPQAVKKRSGVKARKGKHLVTQSDDTGASSVVDSLDSGAGQGYSLVRYFKKDSEAGGQGTLEIWTMGADGKYTLPASQIFKIRHIGPGKGADPLKAKTAEGDGLSPNGVYYFTEKATAGSAKFPVRADINYPNQVEKSRGYTGAAILIHSTDMVWNGEVITVGSIGCIVFTPEDNKRINKLFKNSFARGQKHIQVQAYPTRTPNARGLFSRALSKYDAEIAPQLDAINKEFLATKTEPKVLACKVDGNKRNYKLEKDLVEGDDCRPLQSPKNVDVAALIAKRDGAVVMVAGAPLKAKPVKTVQAAAPVLTKEDATKAPAPVIVAAAQTQAPAEIPANIKISNAFNDIQSNFVTQQDMHVAAVTLATRMKCMHDNGPKADCLIDPSMIFVNAATGEVRYIESKKTDSMKGFTPLVRPAATVASLQQF